jgi:hypothetical protein
MTQFTISNVEGRVPVGVAALKLATCCVAIEAKYPLLAEGVLKVPNVRVLVVAFEA